MTTKTIGDFGEMTVCGYLETKGYRILMRNFHSRYGEIDLIAQDGAYTVFIEVKTRKNAQFGMPAEYVDAKKQEKLIKTAVHYIGEQDIPVRFDVVEVFYEKNGETLICTDINHIENAFGG